MPGLEALLCTSCRRLQQLHRVLDNAELFTTVAYGNVLLP